MADNKDGVKLYITYKNNQATVEIEEDGVRRPHDAKYQNTDKKDKYQNTDKKDKYTFCAEVAQRVENEIGRPTQWSITTNAGGSKQKKTKVVLIVAVTVAALLVVGFAGINAFTHVLANTSAAPSEASPGSGECKLGLLTLKYPKGWKVVRNQEDQYIYPDYGGLLYVSERNIADKITSDNQLDCLEEFLNGMERNGTNCVCDRSTLRAVDMYGLYAYRCNVTMTINNLPYKGSLELILNDGMSYAAIMAVPEDSYINRQSDINEILDSINVYSEQQKQQKQQNSSVSESQKIFEFGDGYDDSNSSYSRYIGTVKNISNETHYFIQVRGSFLDADGNTIDTTWTYACGQEGLRPGESTKFTLSVKADSRIKQVSYNVMDYV